MLLLTRPIRSYELWRRLLLLFCCAVGLWLFTYASPAPLVRVEAVDFQRQQAREVQRPYVTERQRHLAALPLDEYIQAVAKDHLLHERKEEWQEFVTALQSVEQRAVPRDWEHRVQKESLKSGYTPRAYFRPGEEPVRHWMSQAVNRTDPLYITFAGAEGPGYHVRLTYLSDPLDHLQFGGGSAFNLPPASMMRTLRSYSFLAALAGILLYALLPRAGKNQGALRYPGYKSVMGDVAAVILFLVFFGMPMLISGGALQSLTAGLPLAVVFWGMSLMAVWIMYINAWSASFTLFIEEQRLRVSSYRGEVVMNFADVTSFQPVEKEYPRWLRRMTWLGFLVSKGSMKFLMASQLLTGAGRIAGGLRLNLRDGSAFDLWITDQWNKEVLGKGGAFSEALLAGGVPYDHDVAVDRRLTMLPGDEKAWSRGPMVIPMVVCLALMLAVIGATFFLSRAHSVQEGQAVIQNQQSLTENSQDSLFFQGLLVDPLEYQWVQIHGGTGIDRGEAIVEMPDGRIGIAGTSNSAHGVRAAQYLVVTEYDGTLVWERHYPQSGQDSFGEALILTEDGGFAVAGTTGTYLGRNAILTRIGSNGDELWNRGYFEENSMGASVITTHSGEFFLGGRVGADGFVIKATQEGEPMWVTTFDEIMQESTIRQLLPADEGLIAVGSGILQSEEFWRPLLINMDEQGRVRWHRTFGGERDDMVFGAALLEEGGAVITGSTRSQHPLRRDLYLARVDSEGRLEWEKAYGLEGYHVTGTAVTMMPSGEIVVLANLHTDASTHDMSLMIRFDAQGKPTGANRVWVNGDVRAGAVLRNHNGELLITGMAGRQEGYGENSVFLMSIISQ